MFMNILETIEFSSSFQRMDQKMFKEISGVLDVWNDETVMFKKCNNLNFEHMISAS